MAFAGKSPTEIIKSTLTPLISIQLVIMAVCGVALTLDGSVMYVTPFFILLILSRLLYPMFLFPAGIFANIMNLTSVAFPRFSAFMQGLTLCYILAVLTGTAALTFMWILPSMQGKMFLVGLAFGVVAAPAPWAALALKDRGNVLFTSMVLFMQVGMVVMAVVGVIIMNWPLGLLMYKNAALLFVVMGVLIFLQSAHEKKHPAQKTVLSVPDTES